MSRWARRRARRGRARLASAGPLRILGVLAAALALSAADGCSGRVLVGGATLLRVQNASEFEMTDLVIHVPGEPIRADLLGPGDRTDYREAPGAFRIASVDGKVEGETFRIQVIDYVGEEPLGPGRFTYVLSVASRDPLQVGFDLRSD